MESKQANLSIEQVLGVVRRRAPWILLCVVLAAGAAFGASQRQTKMYTATASLVFNNNQTNQQAAGLPSVSVNSQLAQQNTNVKLVQLGDMPARTARRLDQGLTEDKVRENLMVSAQGESNIVNVSATATSPTLAAEIANTYTSVFVTEQQNANHAYYASALALVNKQLAGMTAKQRLSTSGLTLEGRAQSLGVLAELRSGNVQVAQPATVPTLPSSPKVARNTVLGAVLGFLLGLGVAFLLERFDRRIREPKDLEENLRPSPARCGPRERRPISLLAPQRGTGHAPRGRGRGFPSDSCTPALLQCRSRPAHAARRFGGAWRRENDCGASSCGGSGHDGLAGVVDRV